MQNIRALLFRPISSRVPGLFRIFFGLCLIYELWYYIDIDLLNLGLRQPVMLFPYSGLEWIQLLPGKGMEFILVLLIASAVCITMGWKTRVAAVIFFIGFSWIFFLDKSLYNNHLYLFILLVFLLSVTNFDSSFSISKKKHHEFIPAWQLYIFQFQIIIVYFYGGLAKLNTDWLIHFQPAKTLTEENGNSLFLYILIYGGLLFDLLIGFALLWKRSRFFAMIIALVFHITNAIVFNDIGVFPFFMIGSLILFADSELPSRWFKSRNDIAVKKNKQVQQAVISKTAPALMVLISFYVIFQLLFPFRHLLYEGNVDWYGKAQRFSWRMKIQSRDFVEFKLQVLNYETKQILDLEPAKYLTSAQLRALPQDPLMVLAFVKFIEADAKSKGIDKPVIKVKCTVVFNGRPQQNMIDPEKNMCAVNYSDPVNSWVLPLTDFPDEK